MTAFNRSSKSARIVGFRHILIGRHITDISRHSSALELAASGDALHRFVVQGVDPAVFRLSIGK